MRIIKSFPILSRIVFIRSGAEIKALRHRQMIIGKFHLAEMINNMFIGGVCIYFLFLISEEEFKRSVQDQTGVVLCFWYNVTKATS